MYYSTTRSEGSAEIRWLLLFN